jgi:hypothetical protein
MSNRFAALEDLNDVDMNRAKESLGYCELKQPWFDEEYSEPLGQKKQAKL